MKQQSDALRGSLVSVLRLREARKRRARLGSRTVLLVFPDEPDHDHTPEPLVLPEVEEDDEHAAGILKRLTTRAHGLRSWVHQRPAGGRIWRIGIALLGLVVIVVGVVLLVLPGPGWVIIFVGLGIWATEFVWARSLLTAVQRTVRRGTAWIRRQPRWLPMLVGASGLIVIAGVAVVAWLWAS